MRIAYFSDTFHPQINGVSNTLSYLKRYLDKHHIEHQFHVPDYDDAALNADPSVFCAKGIPLPMYHDCKLSLPWPPYMNGVLDSFQPDFIHLATEFGIGLSGRSYARAKQIPIVSSYHTNMDHYIHYYPSLSALKSGVDDYFKWFHRRSRRIFVPTEETKQHLQSVGYHNLSIWSRGIDTELFSPQKASQAFRSQYGLQDQTIVLYVGRIAAEKDIDMLPAAMRLLKERVDNVTLLVTGDGPSMPALRAQAPEGTVFTGFLRGEALAQAYASSDVFFTPSSTETFGNVALEAMASGLPIVAADAGGFKNIIQHGVNGLLSAPRDAAGFAQALESLVRQPERARQMAQRAANYAQERSWDAIFDQLILDYELALERKKRAS